MVFRFQFASSRLNTPSFPFIYLASFVPNFLRQFRFMMKHGEEPCDRHLSNQVIRGQASPLPLSDRHNLSLSDKLVLDVLSWVTSMTYRAHRWMVQTLAISAPTDTLVRFAC